MLLQNISHLLVVVKEVVKHRTGPVVREECVHQWQCSRTPNSGRALGNDQTHPALRRAPVLPSPLIQNFSNNVGRCYGSGTQSPRHDALE